MEDQLNSLSKDLASIAPTVAALIARPGRQSLRYQLGRMTPYWGPAVGAPLVTVPLRRRAPGAVQNWQSPYEATSRVCLFTSGGGDHARFSAFVVFRPRVIRPCLFRIKCVGAEVRRSAVCSSLCIDLVVGKANSALRVRRLVQVRVMLGY